MDNCLIPVDKWVLFVDKLFNSMSLGLKQFKGKGERIPCLPNWVTSGLNFFSMNRFSAHWALRMKYTATKKRQATSALVIHRRYASGWLSSRLKKYRPTNRLKIK